MNRSICFAALLGAALVPSAALADSPREFLRHALQGDNSEMMLGRLAAERGRSSGVRDYGQTLASDHSQAREEVLDVGRRFGLRPDRDPAPEAREERNKLMELRGRDFDREFVRYMIEDHRKDIADFRDEAREHHGPVSDLAQRQLPTLQKHLDMALALGRDNGRFDNGRFDQTRDRNDRYDRQDRNDRDYRRDR
jgi:putative membrane protein